MKRFLLLLTSFALLTACAPAQTPAPTADVAATVQALSGTMIAATLTAQPTSTPLPTATSTATPEPPTATLLPPTETPNAAGGAVVNETPTLPAPTDLTGGTATVTPEPFYGTLDPLGAGDYKQGYFLIENNTKEDFLIVNINGTTNQGNPKPVYYAIKVTTATYLFQIPWGDYQYSVQIGTKKTLSGSFIIRNKDKTTMRVSVDKIIVVGP